MSDHPTAPGRSGVDRRRNGALDGTDTGRRTGGMRPVDAPPGSRGRPPVPPLRPVPTGPRTTMAPFQAAVPGSGAPAERDDLWSSSRPGRGQRAADRRAAGQREADQREAERLAAEQQAEQQREAERLEAQRLEAQRLETERVEAQRREAARREAQRREAERREAERREAERREAERAEAERAEAERHAAAARAAEARARQRSAAPSEAGPASRGDDDWSTGPAGSRPGPPGAARPAGTAPAAGGPAYGDWTRPSRSGDDTGPGRRPAEPEDDYSSQRFARLRAGAPTEVTGIAEPDAGPRRPRIADDRPRAHYDDVDEPAGRDRGPATGPGPVTDPGAVTGVVGGRAAERAGRRAAEEERKKAAKSARAADRAAGVRRGGAPRRAVLGLVAVAVVALSVLGVYSFASPHTQQAASQSPATKTAGDAALGTVPGVSDLPPLSTVPAPTSAAPATPVRVPVTVLNSTAINGLAASIAGAIKGGGWQTLPVGSYQNKDVATTTVYFTQGDEKQRQAALQLIQQFPQLHGPAARFFNVPPAAAGGLVVVATGDWKP